MNISLLSRLSKSVLILTLFTFVVSCGSQKPMISDVKVESLTDQGEVLVSMDAVLNIGNVNLLDITLPIIAPKTQKMIGSVSMYRDMQGQNKFEIEVNLTAIANVEAIVAKLPNGNMLPLIRENHAIVIPIQDKANVYLAFSDGVAALGASVAIRGLDSVGRSVGETSLFPSFNMQNVLGAAGLYTSRTAGQNGFAIFADISNVIDTSDLLGGVNKLAQRQVADEDELRLNYSSITPSRSKKRRLDSKLYRLHRKRAAL